MLLFGFARLKQKMILSIYESLSKLDHEKEMDY